MTPFSPPPRLPLIAAVKRNDPLEVEKLIKNGHDIEERDNSGATGLTWATASGHTGIMIILLDGGANINTVDALGKTPLMDAAGSLKNGALKILLDRNVSLNERDISGNTALHWAIYDGCDINCFLLIKAGADIEACAFGENAHPLHVAAARGRVRIAEAPMRAGAQGDAANSRGDTAGDIAITKGFTHIDQLIREFPAQLAAERETERRRIEEIISSAAILKHDLPISPPFKLKKQMKPYR